MSGKGWSNCWILSVNGSTRLGRRLGTGPDDAEPARSVCQRRMMFLHRLACQAQIAGDAAHRGAAFSPAYDLVAQFFVHAASAGVGTVQTSTPIAIFAGQHVPQRSTATAESKN
jgi:hypothetical protein